MKKEPEKPDEIKIRDMEGVELHSVKVNSIRANKYNCNVMDEAEYTALVADLKQMGNPEGITPIVVRELDQMEKKAIFELIDGEHRWNAAKELKWERLPAMVFPKGTITQQQALVLNFKVNRQRGSHDPFKEAKFYHYLTVNQQQTQKDVGKLLNLDPSTISKRISILNLDPKALNHLPKGVELPVSVLEVVAQGPSLQQQQDLVEMYRSYGYTVENLETEVRQMKFEIKEAEKFKNKIDHSKVKKCPTCKLPPNTEMEPCFTPNDGIKYFQCENRHIWDGKTGKKIEEKDYKPAGSGSGDSGTGKSSEATESKTPSMVRCFRGTHSEEELNAAVRKMLKKAVVHFIDKCTRLEMHIGGDYYSPSNIEFNTAYGTRLSIKSDQGLLSIKSEPKTYKDGVSTAKVDVFEPAVTQKDGTKKAEKLFELLMNNLLTFGVKSKKKEDKKKGKNKKAAKK